MLKLIKQAAWINQTGKQNKPKTFLKTNNIISKMININLQNLQKDQQHEEE